MSASTEPRPNGKHRPTLPAIGAKPADLRAEHAVLGALLMPHGAAWAQVSDLIGTGDFQGRDAIICGVISRLAQDGSPHDLVTVAHALERSGQLEEVGGVPYLTKLITDTPTAEHVRTYAQIVRDNAANRSTLELLDRMRIMLASGVPADEVVRTLRPRLDALEKPTARKRVGVKRMRDIAAEDRDPDWLIPRVLEAGVMALMVGERGSYKSFIALDWSMQVAMAGKSVCLLSAEGAGLSKRVRAWMQAKAPGQEIPEDALALERIVNLNSDETLENIAADFKDEDFKPDLIVVDTFSKYAPGLKENDNCEVAQFLSRLATGLRERYGCTVLLVTHSGHSEEAKGRARGASVFGANTDAEYVVTVSNKEQRLVSVKRDRFKDSPSLEPLFYRLDVVDLGRTDRWGDRVDSLVPVQIDYALQPVAPGRQEPRGSAQRELLAVLRTQSGAGVWTLAEMRELGVKAGMNRHSARSAADGLIRTGFLLPSVGGYTLNRKLGSDDA